MRRCAPTPRIGIYDASADGQSTLNALLFQGDFYTVSVAYADPASTMQVVDALIKANKDLDLLAAPGGEHSVKSQVGSTFTP